METINHDDKPRILTQFEWESLKDWFENNKDEYEISEDFEKWYQSISWSRVDEIMKGYTNEE